MMHDKDIVLNGRSELQRYGTFKNTAENNLMVQVIVIYLQISVPWILIYTGNHKSPATDKSSECIHERYNFQI
jgi:hypothetical protein